MVERITGEYIVKFTPGSAGISEAAGLADAVGAKVLEANPQGLQLWSFDGPGAEQALEALSRNPNVEFVEQNLRVSIAATPDDPKYGSLWGLNHSGNHDIDAPEAWNVATSGDGVTVAVIDTGIDYRHPDLDDNMWINRGEIAGNGKDDDGNGYVDDVYGWDFVNGDSNPMDDHSHGTHVAGTIGAEGNNGIGVTGVAWSANLMAIKAFDSSGSGTSYNIARAIDYATSMGADISSNSWSMTTVSRAVSDAVARAENAGQLFVLAAGNDGMNIEGTSQTGTMTYDNMITVAAHTSSGAKASWSNYGGVSVDLSAPGSGILSTMPGGGYGNKSGTSMATPHVAGAAAVIWSAHPELTMEQVRALILDNVDPMGSMRGLTTTGGGLNLANVLKALGHDTDGTGTTPTPEPQPPAPTDGTAVVFQNSGFTSYDGQDTTAARLTLGADGTGFSVAGNAWKKAALSYTVKADTVLTFEARIDKLGEIQGIGIDSDSTAGNGNDVSFVLAGTQAKPNIKGITYDLHGTVGSEWTTVSINLGKYYTGDIKYLTVLNDHDGGSHDATASYANFRFSTGTGETLPPPPTSDSGSGGNGGDYTVTIDPSLVSSWGTQDGTGQFGASGGTATIDGNAWKKMAVAHTITADTVMTFDVRIDKLGEIQGIGVDVDSKAGNGNDLAFILAGTQAPPTMKGLDYSLHGTVGSTWKTVSIDIGKHYTGDIKYLTFINDHDLGSKDGSASYANIRFSNGSSTTTPEPTTNTAPTAMADAAKTVSGKAVAIDVLGNDSDADGDALVLKSLSAAVNGTATVNSNGTVQYTPNAGFTGTDSFSYVVSDGRGGEATGHVSVTVDPAATGGGLDLGGLVTSYAGQDGSGTATASADGTTMSVSGNAWKKIALDYTVTKDTYLTFDARIDKLAEIQGIGVDVDDKANNGNDVAFVVAGTQGPATAWKTLNYDLHGSVSSDWTTVTVNLGKYITGDVNYLTFVNDHDVSNASGAASWANVRLTEGAPVAEAANDGGGLAEAPGGHNDAILALLDEADQGDSSATLALAASDWYA